MNILMRFGALTGALLLASTGAWAAPLSLTNPNFDADVLPDGSFTCSGTVGFTGWNSFGMGCGTGLVNPNGAMMPGGNSLSNGNAAYNNGPAGYWQSLTDTYQEGVTYTFALQIGQRLDEVYNGYELQFRSGNTVLASDANSILAPAPGTFTPASVSFTVPTGSAVIGQPVTVAFFGGTLPGGVQTIFDNATVDSAVPEPGTYALVGSALIGLAAIRRRRGAPRA